MNKTLQIRTAVIPDAHALKALDTIVPFDPSRAEFIDRWLKEDTVLVAEIEGKIVGYGVFNHAFFHQGQVDMIMIHADYRSQRIGEAILSALEKLCDTPKFYVTTNMSNHRMQRLLSRMEYRAAGYIHELDPDDPELIFVKDIEAAQYGIPTQSVEMGDIVQSACSDQLDAYDHTDDNGN